MLQVCHTEWNNRLLVGESSEDCSVVAELREYLRPSPLKKWLEIKMLKDALRQWDEAMR
jgi:hypothetical protein